MPFKMWPFRSKKISEEVRANNDKLKILILGTLESGKTTLFKQMRWGSYDPPQFEKQEYYRPVLNNVVMSIRHLIDYTENFFHLNFQPANLAAVGRFRVANIFETFSGPITPQDVMDIQTIWNDPAMQQTYARRHEILHLYDSAEYFITSIGRIGSPNYLPTYLDILKTRVRSTGIIQQTLAFTPSDCHLALSQRGAEQLSLGEVERLYFKEVDIIDVGGARTERRKWIHTMDDVTELVFVVSLSEYDMELRESVGVNRMSESLQLFTQIITHQILSTVPLILLFSKVDLFREKIEKSSLRRCFPDYDGEMEYHAGLNFIVGKFMDVCQQQEKKVKVIVANLTDVENMGDVVSMIKGCALYEYWRSNSGNCCILDEGIK